MRLTPHRRAGRGQRFALPTAPTFAHKLHRAPPPFDEQNEHGNQAYKGLMLRRSALRSDCTTVLAPGSCRITRYALARCAQTDAARMKTKRAVARRPQSAQPTAEPKPRGLPCAGFATTQTAHAWRTVKVSSAPSAVLATENAAASLGRESASVARQGPTPRSLSPTLALISLDEGSASPRVPRPRAATDAAAPAAASRSGPARPAPAPPWRPPRSRAHRAAPAA